MSRMAVIGAPVVAATTAPKPMSAYVSGVIDSEGKSARNAIPTATPIVAPTNSDGVNSPPEPPPRSVTEVTSSFPTASSNSTHHVIWPKASSAATAQPGGGSCRRSGHARVAEPACRVPPATDRCRSVAGIAGCRTRGRIAMSSRTSQRFACVRSMVGMKCSG